MWKLVVLVLRPRRACKCVLNMMLIGSAKPVAHVGSLPCLHHELILMTHWNRMTYG